MQILLVEDEKKLAGALKRGLEDEKYSVTLTNSGEEAFFLASTAHFDLLLLDVVLPRRDGIEILKAFRQVGIVTPVLILTSNDAVGDRVNGLDSGADDYLTKPFAFSELVARVRALARRTGTPEAKSLLTLDGLRMDVLRHTVSRQSQELSLTAREFELLEYLLRHQGQVVSRQMLATDVWNENARYTPLDNVIDVHITHLRQKLDGPFEKKLLHTVRSVGFVLKENS